MPETAIRNQHEFQRNLTILNGGLILAAPFTAGLSLLGSVPVTLGQLYHRFIDKNSRNQYLREKEEIREGRQSARETSESETRQSQEETPRLNYSEISDNYSSKTKRLIRLGKATEKIKKAKKSKIGVVATEKEINDYTQRLTREQLENKEVHRLGRGMYHLVEKGRTYDTRRLRTKILDATIEGTAKATKYLGKKSWQGTKYVGRKSWEGIKHLTGRNTSLENSVEDNPNL